MIGKNEDMIGTSSQSVLTLAACVHTVAKSQVNFGLYRGTKPLLVVADPIPGSTELREAMQELNTRMPRKVCHASFFLSPDSVVMEVLLDRPTSRGERVWMIFELENGPY